MSGVKKSFFSAAAALALFLLFSGCSSAKTKTLYLFTWSEFFDPQLIEQFEKKHHCRVVLDTYDSNESLYAKLKLGAAGYDLIFPSGYYLQILYHQKIILPIKTEKIPNVKNLDPTYFKEEEQHLGIPFIVSFTGIAYRKDRVEISDPSWGVFGRKDLRGRMTMLNDIREAIGASLKYLGYSVNSKDPEQLFKAGNVLIGWKKNLAKFDSELYKSGIATREFLVSQGYSIDVMQVIEEDSHVGFLFPKEGAILSVDYIAVPVGSKNKALALEFINFLLEPENAAKNMAYTKALIPVKPAYQLLSPEMKESKILFPTADILEKMERIEDLQEDIKLYFETWERVKGG